MTNQEIDVLHDCLNALIEMEMMLTSTKIRQKKLVEMLNKLAKQQHRKGTKQKIQFSSAFC